MSLLMSFKSYKWSKLGDSHMKQEWPLPVMASATALSFDRVINSVKCSTEIQRNKSSRPAKVVRVMNMVKSA
jgi:hypothetical protein